MSDIIEISGQTPTKRPAGIILAAGASTRLGRPKQLLEFDDQPLLAHVIRAAVESNLEYTILILGHRATEIKKVLGSCIEHEKLCVIVNRDYRNGMAGSLKMGLKQIMDEYFCAMIILADHPFLDSFLINHLLYYFMNSDKTLCAPTYKGRRGHPVIFGNRFFSDILSISGDIGAREIFHNNPNQILAVELDDSRVFMDIDTESDFELAQLLRRRITKTYNLIEKKF